MAFYRCDRGLGFDTSNTTGTENDVLYNKKFNNGENRNGNIKYGVYSIQNVNVFNFNLMLKFQTFCNYSTQLNNYSSIVLSPEKYFSGDAIKIPATNFDSDNYKDTIYGNPGNSELKFINKKYKENVYIPCLYSTGQIYFEKSYLSFTLSFDKRNLLGSNRLYSNNVNNLIYNISFDNELIKNLYNIAKSENNSACNELMTIGPDNIGKIFTNSDLNNIISPYFVYKTQNNDIYLYHYYSNNANNVINTNLNLAFNNAQSDDYPALYNTFSNKKMYLHEPYIKITNDGKIEHLPIINTTPNSNVIFSQSRVTSFQSQSAISDENIYNIYSSLNGIYFRKYNLNYELILEIKINTDQFYFSKSSSNCLNIDNLMYCYDNNIIIINSEWCGRNIASLDYDGNLISVLSYHYNKLGVNTRCLRVLPRKDYIGIFTSDYTYYDYTTNMRIANQYYNYLVDNNLLSLYNTYKDLNFLNYIELDPYNLDIVCSIEYDRYCIPYNTKFGIRSYLGINRDENNNIIYIKYPLCSYNKIPLIPSVYSGSTPYLVNVRDDRSMIISKNNSNYLISIYDTLYLLNDYDTNYNGYNIDNTNSNYTDYYFN